MKDTHENTREIQQESSKNEPIKNFPLKHFSIIALSINFPTREKEETKENVFFLIICEQQYWNIRKNVSF